MKRLPLLITEPARDDLREVRRWLRKEAGPRAAAKVLTRLDDVLARLRAWPLSSAAQPDYGREVRFCSVDSYVIYYTVGATELTILRVLHASRDRDSIMRG